MFRRVSVLGLAFCLSAISIAACGSQSKSEDMNDDGPHGGATGGGSGSGNPANPEMVNVPSWIEPKALNVSDLVGRVPEEHLRDIIVTTGGNGGGGGLVQYLDGKRVGNKVTLHVALKPNLVESQSGRVLLSCLSELTLFDH